MNLIYVLYNKYKNTLVSSYRYEIFQLSAQYGSVKAFQVVIPAQFPRRRGLRGNDELMGSCA
jgi:hypothetical protein